MDIGLIIFFTIFGIWIIFFYFNSKIIYSIKSEAKKYPEVYKNMLIFFPNDKPRLIYFYSEIMDQFNYKGFSKRMIINSRDCLICSGGFPSISNMSTALIFCTILLHV